MRPWIDVATLVKLKNLNGRFVVHCSADLPFLLTKGLEVAFVPPQLDVARRAFVKDVQLIDDTRGEVSFEGLDGHTASVLVGCHCLLRREDVSPDILESAQDSWEGFTIVDDVRGPVGTLAAIIENPGQDLLEVTPLEEGSSFLVPLVDPIVYDVDSTKGEVYVDLPKGLLEL